MIRLIFIIIAFMVMMGGLIGGLYFWGIDPLQKFNALIGNVPASMPQQPAPAPPSFVEYGLLSVPLIEQREVHRQAELILRLQVPVQKRDVVAQNIPRLQSAYLAEMMEFLPILLRDGRRLDINAVRRRLQVVTDATLGAGLVKDVLVDQSTIK